MTVMLIIVASSVAALVLVLVPGKLADGKDKGQDEKDVESTSPEHKDSAAQGDEQGKGESPEERFGWAASTCVPMLKMGSLPGEIAGRLGGGVL